jgi:hypothetical protein
MCKAAQGVIANRLAPDELKLECLISEGVGKEIIDLTGHVGNTGLDSWQDLFTI